MKSLVCGAAVVFAGVLCPVMADVVSFKDAAKIKSWDAWEDHEKKSAITNILQNEKRSVTWEKFNKADPGLKEIGRVQTRTSMEIKSSKWSVDCCTLDRDYAVWDSPCLVVQD